MPARAAAGRAVLPVLFAVSFCHCLNDLIQSLIPAVYPLLKRDFALNFTQVGLITFTFQCTGALFQPFIGLYTDRKPKPFSLPIGMGFTLIGLLLLSRASSFPMMLVSAGLVGLGSSVFHPESSRLARLASGGQHGFAQSLFQVGGNAGGAIGPLLAAWIVVPHGQKSLSWFSVVVVAAILILSRLGFWYRDHERSPNKAVRPAAAHGETLPPLRVAVTIGILLLLIFSKYFYLVSLTNYYTFYLIGKFGLSIQDAQLHLFAFSGAVAVGTILGGPIGDRIGRKIVIWCSILGVLPFTLLMPFANLFWTGVLSVVIGLVLASAFSAIVVYAQDLLPGKVGLVSGLFFGFAFGMAGVGAAVLGKLVDMTSLTYVYHLCSYLPALGLLAGFLPDTRHVGRSVK